MAMCARRHELAQARQALGVEERRHSCGRAGDEHDELAIACEGGVEPLAGRAAVGVGQDGCALEDVGLLEVVGGMVMRQVAARACERGDLRGVAAQRERERFGDGFAGEVVFSGAEAAHEDENVDAAERGADGVDEVLAGGRRRWF